MATPIKETPTIKGKDSIRFQEAMDNPIPKEQKKNSSELMNKRFLNG